MSALDMALRDRIGVDLLLENLNREPEHAEIRYLAHRRLIAPRRTLTPPGRAP